MEARPDIFLTLTESESIFSLMEDMVMEEAKPVRKPIKPKVVAGTAGTAGAVPLMVIFNWILGQGFGVTVPEPVLIAGAGLLSGFMGFLFSYWTDED